MPEPTDTPRTCELCGTPVRVMGTTTQWYVPTPPPAPEPGADAAWEALAQALDRMETAWNALGPDVWADSAKGEDGPAHLVAQTLWFGQEEARAALDSSRAALARPTPALDVEALAEALHRLQGGPHRTRYPAAGEGYDSCDLDAEALAREYAVSLAARATEGGTDR